PTKEEPPSPPVLDKLMATEVTSESVQLEWSVPEGTFDSFTVQYRDAQGQPQVLPVAGDSRTVTVTGLSPSRRYKFNLYGVWGRKHLGPISTDAVTVDGCAMHYVILSTAASAPEEENSPFQPRLGSLTASHINSDAIQLEWSVPEGTFDSFTVQYRDAQGQLESLLVDGGSHRVTVPGLLPSHRYNFYLYGLSGQKRLGPISLDTITGESQSKIHPCPLWALSLECAPAPSKEELPSPPHLGELMASQVTPDSVKLEWSVPKGTFDSFIVQYRDAQGQPQMLPVAGDSRTVTVT
ncbi:TENX protein, partial [Upupa epops]|nr:TENX protein [Upupa epops]